MKKDITELFIFVYDFCNAMDTYLKQYLLENDPRKKTREPGLTPSEILTIILLYQQSPCKNFKFFYLSYLQLYQREFPNLTTYQRFIALKPRGLVYLIWLIQWYCYQASQTGISYIDSTSLAVCHPKRISRNKVFKGIALLGKTTKGWFFGFKLHLLINQKGEMQGVQLTQGNVDDRRPVPELTKHLTGLLFEDKGYIKQALFENLYQRGLKLVTGIKKGMQNKLFILREKLLLRKRSIIETVFDILKNTFGMEHSRHRSIWNALVHIFSSLIAYSMKPSKPSIKDNFLIQH